MLYFDISAKTGENVQNMFVTMAKSLLPIENYNNILQPEKTVSIYILILFYCYYF